MTQHPFLRSLIFRHPLFRSVVAGLMRLLEPCLAVVLGLAAGLLVTFIAGENPLSVLGVLARSAFGSWYDFGMTLSYATPLVFTGLSVAVAFHAGLFNIGAEGQLAVGAFAAAAVGVCFPNVPWPLAPLLAGGAAFASGAMYGALPGWLLAKRGSHEVITTIMLNFIAAALVNWLAINVLPNPASQNAETPSVGTGYLLSHFSLFGDAPVSTALVLAIGTALALGFFLGRTRFGFELQAVGQSEGAARFAGIDPGRTRIIAMALAGGLAGLVGISEVLGHSGKFKLGFSPDYGFIGIAVALLARGRPSGILASALLFGALHKGTADLDLETDKVTRDVSLVLQAMVIFAVSADGLWFWVRKRVATASTVLEAGARDRTKDDAGRASQQ